MPGRVEATERLVRLSGAWGQPAKATEWRKKLAEEKNARNKPKS
jgi:hypothetical protein